MSSSEVTGSIPTRSSCSVDSGGFLSPGTHRGLPPPMRPPQMALGPGRLHSCSSHPGARRRKREMIPADKKDATYWAKRHKNNEAAKRSREKRRFQDLLLGGQLLALSEENAQLRMQLLSLQYRSGLSVDGNAPAAAAPGSNPPPLFQGGLWGSAAVMETGIHFDDTISCFTPNRRVGVYDTVSHRYCKTPQGPEPLARLLARPFAVSAGVNLSMGAEIDAQKRVYPSEDASISTSLSSPKKAVSPLDTPPHDSTQTYLFPHLPPPAACNLLPWSSSYLTAPSFYSPLPLHMQQMRQVVGGRCQGRLRYSFSCASGQLHLQGDQSSSTEGGASA
ncbi:uncharacterized protein LOC118598630 [Oryzias melastigma]|uniref:uncharacterized protein LOC118598630 n=1 Tax=Oryzias melastigma TaxID=30732 RepID=UPI00168D0904|nr:uncharacterized protein LOC118598630 [Oryzias melastigma]